MARSAGAPSAMSLTRLMSWPSRCLVEAGAGVVLGQHAFERSVVALDRAHGVVDELADGRLRRHRFEVRPARLRRHPENAHRAVFVRVLRIGALLTLRIELGVLGLKCVGNVLEKDQPEHDVLVLGRVHVVAQCIGRRPEFGLEAEIRGAAVVFGLGGLLRCSCHCYSSRRHLCPSGTDSPSGCGKQSLRMRQRCLALSPLWRKILTNPETRNISRILSLFVQGRQPVTPAGGSELRCPRAGFRPLCARAVSDINLPAQ